MKKSVAIVARIAVFIAFALYLVLVVKILLFKFGRIDLGGLCADMAAGMAHPELIRERLANRGNLIFFHEIRHYLDDLPTGESMIRHVNFIGNILAFLPFGFLLPLLRRPNRGAFLTVTLLSFLFSLCLETAQLLADIGIFDVDDLLLNTVGGVLGYFFYRLGRLVITAGGRIPLFSLFCPKPSKYTSRDTDRRHISEEKVNSLC
ncbi:VanZ family protein [Brevibacillus brevis]|uniref:VanZ family protein n=1 Tax=Brevibacillus brevis TaxID=1393 RepID=A0ABY9T3S0_BREBE|nr:VanZ family protein [Brevibacillus brevis]WNC14716.1 VanZ family protein [Brevibacillus brevis]